MSALILSELWRYPVKSMRGNRCARLKVTKRGPEFDRHWMLVNPQGRFVTQRQEARMALLAAQLLPEGLKISAPGMADVLVDLSAAGEVLSVEVWGDQCRAHAVSDEADRLLSEFLQQPVRLVVFPEDEVRTVDQQYAAPGDQTAFADGFPFLLISQASLDELNGRLDQPVSMRRFRPNLVVSGCEAFAEDDWKLIRVGDLTFRVVKPCSRCGIPNIDPDSAEKTVFPIKTLMTYRRRDKQVYFGQNLIHDAMGELAEGMPVEILE